MRYNYADVKKAFKPVDAWWTVTIADPIAGRLTLFLANYTSITPNIVTILAFTLSFAAAFLFYQATPISLALGTLLFEIGFIFDCVDGKLARLKGLRSKQGEIIDFLFDRLGFFLLLGGLMFGQFRLYDNFEIIIWGFFIIFLDNYINFISLYLKIEDKSSVTLSVRNIFGKTKALLNQRRLASFFTTVEVTQLLFFFTPLTTRIQLGFLFANFAYLLLTFYLLVKLKKVL